VFLGTELKMNSDMNTARIIAKNSSMTQRASREGGDNVTCIVERGGGASNNVVCSIFSMLKCVTR